MEEKDLGTLIKEARKNQNKTLKELSSEIGVEPSTLQKYESGAIKNIPYDKLKKISTVTNSSAIMASSILGGVFGFAAGALAVMGKLSEDKNFNLEDSLKDLILFFRSSEIDSTKKKEIFEILQNEYFKNKYK